jgi:predicted HicB family RNase H-like nuclease
MKRVELTLRLPVELHQELVAEADRFGISLNALILIKLVSWAEGKDTP